MICNFDVKLLYEIDSIWSILFLNLLQQDLLLASSASIDRGNHSDRHIAKDSEKKKFFDTFLSWTNELFWIAFV